MLWNKNAGCAMATAARLRSSRTRFNCRVMLTSGLAHDGLKTSVYDTDLSECSLEDYTIVCHVMTGVSGLTADAAPKKLGNERDVPTA